MEPIIIAKSNGKPVKLHPNGMIECGRIRYAGSRTRRFKEMYRDFDLVIMRYPGIKRDQSGEKILFVGQLLDDMESNWQKSVTIGRVRILAEQARIRSMVTMEIMPVFMGYLNRRWRREFKSMNEEERRQHTDAGTLL